MARADYAHWNEDADLMWWNEEGRHSEEPDYDPDAFLPDLDAQDAFAEDVAEWDSETIQKHLNDPAYLARWPLAERILRTELEER